MCSATCAILILTTLSIGLNLVQAKLLYDADKKYYRLLNDKTWLVKVKVG